MVIKIKKKRNRNLKEISEIIKITIFIIILKSPSQTFSFFSSFSENSLLWSSQQNMTPSDVERTLRVEAEQSGFTS